MEIELRAAVIEWLRTSPDLAGLNAIEEESPLRASAPWLGIATSASTDWGSKERAGREVRIAFELVTRGDEPAGDAPLVRAIEARLAATPSNQFGFQIVTARFLRARAERRAKNQRATLIEYAFRILANPTE